MGLLKNPSGLQPTYPIHGQSHFAGMPILRVESPMLQAELEFKRNDAPRSQPYYSPAITGVSAEAIQAWAGQPNGSKEL